MRKSYVIPSLILLIVLIAIIGLRISDFFLPSHSYDRTGSIQKFNEITNYVSKFYVEDVAWDKTMQGAIEGMLSKLDPHSVYIDATEAQLNEESFEGKYQGIGIQYDVIERYLTVITAISGSPSEKLGLMAGDRIIKIDGESVLGISNNEVPKRLKGPKGSSVDITVLREGIDTPLEFTIVRDEIPIYTVNNYFLGPQGTGYIFLNRFAKTTDQEFEDAMSDLEEQGMERLLLDLRGNAGGYLDQAVKLAAKFLHGNSMIVYTKGRLKEFNEEYHADSFGSRKVRDLPLIVMINQASASASEIFAGAMQDYDRALIVGATSFGKGLVQREFPLNDDSRLRLTISKYYTPSGRLIQKPYQGKKLEQYYGQAQDSIQSTSTPDSLKNRPVFFTFAGRKVYGGGGITPDSSIAFVSNIKSAVLMQKIIQKRLFFEVATKFVSRNTAWDKSFEDFLENYKVDNQLLREFTSLAEEKGIRVSSADIKENYKYIESRIKAEIARSKWGNDRYYRVLLQYDNQYLTALQLFPEALKMVQHLQNETIKN